MIQDFFKTIQQDFVRLGDYAKASVHTDDQDERASLAALRIFAAVGMGVAGIVGISAFSAGTATGAILTLAASAAIYAASHDVFVMAVNKENGAFDQIVAAGKGIVEDLKDLWHGKKDLDDAPRHPATDGTFFRPVWDAVIAQG